MKLHPLCLWSVCLAVMGFILGCSGKSSPPAAPVRTVAPAPAAATAPTPAATTPAAEWPIAAQPDLAAQIERAPYLLPDDLGPGAMGVDPPTSSGSNLVRNPDGKSWDVLLWYRLEYTHKTRVHVVDLGTMKVTRQDFRQEEGRVRIEQGFTWWGCTAADGTLFGAQPDTNTGAINIYRYDADRNRVELFKTVPDMGGERTNTALSPNGWIYGTGTWLGEADKGHKASAYGFNPATGEVRSYGAVGPRIDGPGYGYTMGCDDTHLYVACGQIPWYLVAVNLETGEQTVLAKAPEGGYQMRMSISPRYGGAEAFVQQSDDGPRQQYWLYHGKAIPKEGDTPPWGDLKAPRPESVPAPQIDLDDTYPDANDHATLWWRATAQDTWQPLDIEGVEKHPLKNHRLALLDDGRLWGTADGYKGRFLYDPKIGRLTQLGDGAASIYAVTVDKGTVYWSGYPSGPIYAFDPNKPWTVNKGGPPGTPAARDEDRNPRLLHSGDEVTRKTRVKKMLSAAVAGDGKVYFGGKGMRDYIGGSLSWHDPATGKLGGLWEPFKERSIGYITTAANGRYVLASTTAKIVFIFDTQTGQVIRSFEPVPGAAKGGPLLEVAPGRMLGITDDPKNKQGSVIYGVEIPSGRVIFRTPVPYALQFTWSDGLDQTDFQKGPDGMVWTYLGNALVRIDPKDVHIDVLGKVYEFGTMCFVGNDLYVTGTTRMRRYTNIVAKAPALARASAEAARAAAPIPPTPADAPPVKIELEAEAAALVAPMVALRDEDASGGKYIASESDNEGMALYDFSVPTAGQYIIWARIYGPSASADSIFVLVDSGPQDVFDMAEEAHEVWRWKQVNGRGSGGPLTLNPRIFPLTAGQHRLILRCREPNARVDRLVITNDLNYKPQ